MSRYNDRWSPYVPVAERRAKAVAKMAKLRKLGVNIQPVTIEGRTIARSFWGKAWCAHLDTFGDHSNRLPRGRTYVRNGSVCHLDVSKGNVEAIVSGSSLYTVTMCIKTLSAAKWIGLKQRCSGGIGSLLALLQGQLSDEIMTVVTDPTDGLFPHSSDIHYQCTCPDYAGMCKHIAAVVYGIGARLDERPELLFVLRGVDHAELIDTDAAATAALATGGSRPSRRRTLATNQLDDVFGVEFDTIDDPSPNTQEPPSKSHQAKKTAKKTARKARAFRATGASIRKLRSKLNLSRQDFATKLGVSAQSVTNWEGKSGPLNLHAANLVRLQALARETDSLA